MRAGDPLHGAASRGHCALLSAAAERRCEDCPASGFEESVSRGSSESEVSEIRWAAGSGGFEVRLQLGVCMVSPRPLAPLCAQTAEEEGEKLTHCTQPGAEMPLRATPDLRNLP